MKKKEEKPVKKAGKGKSGKPQATKPTTSSKGKSGKPQATKPTTSSKGKGGKPQATKPTTSSKGKSGKPQATKPTTTSKGKSGKPQATKPTTSSKGKSGKPQATKPTTSSKGKREEKVEVPSVYWASIKNNYMYPCKNEDEGSKSHIYAVYRDKETGKVRAIQCHHLYEADKKNISKVKRGLFLKVKTTQAETPSGLDNYYYDENIHGKGINLNSSSIVSIDKTPINDKTAKQIIEFAKTPKK